MISASSKNLALYLMPSFERLLAAARQRELVASRRLARKNDCALEQALRQTMTAAAPSQTLAELVQARELHAVQVAAKIAQRRQQKTDARAQKAALLQPDPGAWLAWFDGSSHPNPGKLGIGGVLRSPAGVTLEICRMAGHGDSNEAEYLALIAVLEAALAAGVNQLIVYGDSQVVMGMLACAHPAAHLVEHSQRARALAAQIRSLTLTWIPRHRNAAADALSRQAIGFFPAAAAP
jgi:ribonuclease HI